MIKKHFLLLIATLLVTTGVLRAQDTQTADGYNRFTIEAMGGFNSAFKAFEKGTQRDGILPKQAFEYYTDLFTPWSAELAVRYMANPKFGLRLGGSYDNFVIRDKHDATRKFNTALWTVNLQGVANLGRIMNFESWTSDIGLLANLGFGYGQLLGKKDEGKGEAIGGTHSFSFILGLTPQVRLSNRVTLFLNFSGLLSLQNVAYDLQVSPDNEMKNGKFPYRHGLSTRTTIGISVALGKYGRHADWVYGDSRINALEGRVSNLENQLAEMDKRVAANTINDANNNRVADEVEQLLESDYAKKTDIPEAKVVAVDVAGELIKQQYVSIYFDFGSSKPQAGSGFASNFVVKYLRANPSATVSIEGYADELGSKDANQKLSQKRVDVAKKILLDAGIEENRIVTAEGKGVDDSVKKESAEARQIARRATYKLQ